MDNNFLTSLIVYLLCFAGMYFYSLKRDDECGLERNPREAFLLGLFWFAPIAIFVIWIVVEMIINLLRDTYNRNKKNG